MAITRRRATTPMPQPAIRRPDGRLMRAAEVLAVEMNVTPKQVLLAAMNAVWRDAEAEPDPDAKQRLTLLAAGIAAQAAPYEHPRLQSTTVHHRSLLDGLTLEQLEQLADRFAGGADAIAGTSDGLGHAGKAPH